MATTTTKLGLIKPDFVDVVDISELNSNADDIDAAVGSTIVTSITRPGSPFLGQVIYETDTEDSFVWDGSTWKPAGGGTSNVASDCIQPNFNTISENYTFDAGYNGVSAGPITIASGFTVTVPSGSGWSIV
jgi:hypothetical protein